jgi:photosystem II stability/assembly factor-like uncharacterized protein
MSSWRFMQTVTTSSLVGIDVVNREIVWAAAGGFDAPGEPHSPGVVVRTVDGGQSWQDVTPSGGADLDFHDVEAFDRNHALALAVGLAEASKIYRTADGGASWELVFENQEPDAFYDGIAFFDPVHGLALSDPVGGKFRILTTGDGGRTWQVAPTNGMPPALPNEFARATGTCLVTKGPQDAWFGTQPEGPNSRVFHTRDRGHTWSAVTTPIPGAPQFGIASLTFWDAQHGLALGGGKPDTNAPSLVAVTADGGTTWSQVGSPAGFRTSIALAPTNIRDTAVAVGLTGSDFTTDGGHTWQLFDQTDLRGVNCKQNVSCWAVGKSGMAAELMR